MKRAAASVRWVVLSFLSLRRRCLRQSMRPTRGSTFPTPMIYALEFYCGLAKTPAGRTIDRTRSAPSRGFVRPMEASRRMLSRVECTTREESSRQIRALCLCFTLQSTRENIRFSLHRAHVASIRVGATASSSSY